MLNSNSNTIRWMIALLEIIFINPDPPLLWPVHAEKPMSHPRNSSSRKRMLYPRLTYGADKRYLRRKSLIKIYRRENRGERVSKGDVNEPGPNLLPLSSSSSFYSYESHVYTKGVITRRSINFNFDLCRPIVPKSWPSFSTFSIKVSIRYGMTRCLKDRLTDHL